MTERTEEKRETRVPAVQRAAISAGGIGFLLALIGLLCFWVPWLGVGFWFLGLLFSFAGMFSASRGFAFSGFAVSVITCGFILFLAQGKPFENVLAEIKALSRTEVAEEASAPPESAPHVAAVPAGVPVAESTPTAEDSSDEIAGTDSDDDSYFSDEETPEVPEEIFDDDGSAEKTVSGELFPPFPVARFEEISRKRTTWPKYVRLTRARKISLWDDVAKEIMGKMEIPAGTPVEVLGVRSDGALEVLDRTGQRFRVLAADTNFAEMWTVKNGE